MIEAPPIIRAVVNRVVDGDTISVYVDGQLMVIRLCGIDAPEMRQPLGKPAKDRLSVLLPVNTPVQVIQRSKDRYGRSVGDLYAMGVYINAQLVSEGLAYAYHPYIKGCDGAGKPILDAETEAKEDAIGVWGIPNTPPWVFRKAPK